MTRAPFPRAVDGAAARKNELAKIHIGVAALGWAEDDYRAILFAKTGKHSAADLDTTGRKRFIEHLRACGWNGNKPGAAAHRYTKQQWRIRMQWRELGAIPGVLRDPSDKGLNAFIRESVGVDDLRFLGTAQASQVIEALKSWLLRVKR